MTGADDPDDVEETTSKLNEGLKNCRAVVSGYRTLLAQGQNIEDAGAEERLASSEPEDADQ